MTCTLVTPWWRQRRPATGRDTVAGGTAPTPILDWTHPLVRALAAHGPADDPVTRLRAAHRLIATTVRPVYSVNDKQPISRTLRRGRGSCSQRLAILEGVARGQGIPTRVRGLVVHGSFWYARFRHMPFLVPSRVILAWPEFRLREEEWTSVGELFGTLTDLSAAAPSGFTNNGGETLFDAVARTAVDWDGLTCGSGAAAACDLSATVLVDLGHFDSRDELFARHGQTLCAPVTVLAEPFLSRWSPVRHR